MTLHLIRSVLDRREVARRAPRRAGSDEGYTLHAALAHAFAVAPDEPAAVPFRTFAVDDTFPSSDQALFLLAYSERPATALREAFGPDGKRVVQALEGREVPLLPRSTELRFRLRAMPVVRTKTPPPGGAPAKTTSSGRPGSREVDAFLHARFADWSPDPPSFDRPFERREWEWEAREQAYREWFLGQLNRHATGAAELTDFALESFRRARLYRRGGGPSTAPDCVLTGRLRVQDPEAFLGLLARGVGRHRAFGYGMLRVRPA